MDRVKTEGDKALFELTEKFDGIKITPENMRLTKNDIAAAYEKVPADLLAALRRAKANIENYHKKQLLPGALEEGAKGARIKLYDCGERRADFTSAQFIAGNL